MQMKKKGVSEVVATVLILVVAIAAVAILWYAIRGGLKSATDDVNERCLKVNLEPVVCSYNVTKGVSPGQYNVTVVSVNRNNEAGNITKIKYLFKDANGNQKVFDSSAVMQPLETAQVEFQAVSDSVVPVSVKVAPVFTNADGKDKVCQESITEVECK